MLLFLREKRGVFINSWTLPSRIIASLINILFYWFAAKAFIPNDALFGESDQLTLFYYVMIGELTLFFAMDTLLVFSHQTKQIINEGVLETLVLSRTPFPLTLMKLATASLGIGSLTFFLELTILVLFFEFHFPLTSFLQAGLIQILFIPIFIGLGLCAVGLLIYFKRGMNALATGLGVLSILSGTYFPTEVFPTLIQALTHYLNPLHIMLAQVRALFNQEALIISWIEMLLIGTIGGAALIILGVLLIEFSLVKLRRSGGPILMGT